LYLFALPSLAFAEAQGSLCLSPGAFDALGKGGATVEPAPPPPGEAVRWVQLDQRAPAKVTSQKAGSIPAIPLAGKHIVRVAKRADMKELVTTFFFRFQEQGANDLCLYYGSFYGSWLLRPRKGTACPCR
jgi:hypothetical protein